MCIYTYEIHAPPATTAQISYRSRHIRSDDSLTVPCPFLTQGIGSIGLSRAPATANRFYSFIPL